MATPARRPLALALLTSTMAGRVGAALVLAIGAASAGGCRTGLWELAYDGVEAGVPYSGEVPLDAAVDLRLPDLTIPPNNCGDYVIETTHVVRADLLLVQDKSRSMAQGLQGERNPLPGQSKWEQVRAAIDLVVARTTEVDWGLMLFGRNGGCAAPTLPDVPVGAGNAKIIQQVLAATQLDASTPTTATIKNATTWFGKLVDQHPHYLVLATDGAPTCFNGGASGRDEAAAIAAVAAARAAGVPTFVVGIGATPDAVDTLNKMALAGGVPNTTPGDPSYYPVGSSKDLVDILERAAIRITPCSYPLTHDPPVRDAVTIQSATGIIPRDVTHADGWDYSEDFTEIIFFGPACAALKGGSVKQVEAVYACPGG